MYQESVRSTTAGKGQTLLAIVAIFSLLLSMFALTVQPVSADGQGSPPECLDTTPGVTGSINSTSDNLATFTAPAGEVVTGVCIKAGDFHSNVITANGPVPDSCFVVAGIGTPTVTVTRSGSEGECSGLSHIDVLTGPAPQPDVTVDKDTSADPVNAGSMFDYEIDVIAQGTGTSTNVTLSDTLPSAFTYGTPVITGGDATDTCSITANVLNCSFGDLASGTTVTVTIPATTDAADCGAPINNTANVASGNDTNAGNNSDSADVTVVCVSAGEGNLEVDKLICLAETASTDFDVTMAPIQSFALEDIGDCMFGAGVTFSVFVDANGNMVLDEGEVLSDDEDLVDGTLTTNENGAITIDLPEGDYILVEAAGGIEQGDWPGGSVAFSIEDGTLTLIEVTNNIAEEEENGLLKIRKFFCDTAAPEGFDNPHFIELEGPEADTDASLPDQFAESCSRGGDNPEATFEIDGREFTTTDGILVVSLPAGEHDVVETDPNEGSTTVTVEVDGTTSLLVLNFEEGGQQPDTGDIMIMKHVCPAGLTPQEFDQIATFGEKVFTCPVITLPGDEAAAGARDASDLENSAFPNGTGEFDFSVVAGTTSLTLADDGTFIPVPTTCPDSGACIETSHYGFVVPQGEVTVTETDPPAGYDFGRVLFTPESGDEATLVSATNGVIVLDTSEDDSVMLHVYNFAPAQEQLGSITVQKEIECEVCETFTPGFFFNQGENNEGSAFAEDSLGNDPITIDGMTFDSVQSVQDNTDPGSLLRHYLALVLNTRLGDANDCDLLAVTYSGSMEAFVGMTIGDILAEAETVLNGGSSEFTEEQLHDVIDEINNADVSDDTLTCSDSTGLAGFDFVLTDEEDVEHTGTTNAEGTIVFDDLPLGTYTLEETGGPDGSDCTVVSASGDGVEFDAETGVITITLTAEMADVTVTVVNDCGGQSGEQLGSITILKNAVPDDAQDFAFTTTGTGLSGFSLDDDADAALSNQRTFTSLAAGTYSVTEATTAGWDLTSITCSAGGTADMANRTANITLAAGADVTCTFVNTQQGQQAQLGSITILKNAVPDDAQDFAFTTTGTGLSGFSLDDDANATLSNQRTFTGLGAGMYTVAEGSVTGWVLASLTCSPSAAVTVTGSTASINLAAGANVTCTFVNNRSGSGTLPNQGGPTVTPRQGTLAGNLPNTATEPFDGSSLPAAFAALLMLTGLGAAAYAMKAEASRRR